MSSESLPKNSKPLAKARKYLSALGPITKDKLKKFSRSTSQLNSDASGSKSPSNFSPTLNVEPILGQQSLNTAPLQEAGPSLVDSDSGIDPSADVPTRSTSWARLETVLQVLYKASELVPPLHSATGALLSCLHRFEAAAKNHEGYEDLMSELETMATFLSQHLQEPRSSRITRIITRISELIDQNVKEISKNQKKSLSRRIVEAPNDEEELLRYYRRIEGLFRRLQIEVSMSAWSIANDHLVNTRLETLNPAKMASFNSKLGEEVHRRTCTEHTREAILSGLNSWSDDPQAKQIYWMNGMAGTGKTTIACTLAKILESSGQLGASFFCTRTSPECRDAGRIVPTIAYQLARHLTPFQSALCEALDGDPDTATRNIVSQFEQLLKDPLRQAKGKIPNNLVVVIDALDECDNSGAVKLVLETLLRFATDLPIKFFVTSRPESKVHDTMSRNEGSRAVLHLHEIEKSIVQADIELYLREELKFMSPSDCQISRLVEHAGSLFIYAATAVRYIREDEAAVDPDERLSTVLGANSDSKKNEGIDELYTTVLATALNEKRLEANEVERIRTVLWVVVCAREPVPVETLTELAGIANKKLTLVALKSLRSVLYFSGSSNLVSTLHASFPDYMFDHKRSGKHFCDEKNFSQVLAQRCFEVMKAQLRFNICQLESSFVLDKSVGDLDQRVTKNISAPVAYACRHWAGHLQPTAVSKELCDILEDFLWHRLLFWLEVMNLKQWISDGVRALSETLKWLTGVDRNSDIRKSTSDAQVFAARYAGAPISLSTPHIYISALPLSSKSSEMFKRYREEMRGLIDVRGSAIEQRELVPLATWVTDSRMHTAVFFPDSTRVASGSESGTITVWDATNGKPIVGPLRGHTGAVWSVAVSLDGTRVASCSTDRTIRVWDASNGLLITGPFHGHTNQIWSIAFSPDGARIVSGSRDCTIRVWDTTDGTGSVLFRGPSQACIILAVAFSPDGTRIASGSGDRIIRVLDAASGTPVVDPFHGHANSVMTIAFSPDGTRIASGSGDYTIRVWNATNGTPVANPFRGHTGDVTSVAFSPDGMCIASSSEDCTIRLWDATNGTTIAGPFHGHTELIRSVSFSPDGTRIVSGSRDRTIRMWDATHDTPIARLLQGHSDEVHSAAFSPDGTLIALGSRDCTVWVWDAIKGIPVVGPLVGHTEPVYSVAFSPDGARIASGSFDHTIRVWDAVNGKPIIDAIRGHLGDVWSLVFSPNGRHIVTGSSDRTIRLWDSTSGKPAAPPFQGHSGTIWSVAYSPNGARIASGSEDQTIRVWDPNNGALITKPFHGHTDRVLSVSFSPDSIHIVSGSYDGTIRVWSATDGTLISGPFHNHTDIVRSVTFSPDGKCIISSSDDRTIRISDVITGARIYGPFYGHTGIVWSAAISADGTRIVSSSRDRTVLVSNIKPSNKSLPAFTGSLITDNNGWLTNDRCELLFWVPQELRDHFPRPHNPLVITPQGSIQVDYNNLSIGDRWYECYPEV